MKRNIYIYYIVSFLSACIFLIPIWSFFFVNHLHFSFWTALFVTVLSWLVSFIFEIPSWARADRFGRKITYLIWLSVILFWYSFYTWADNVFLYIIASIFLWLWFAMTSWNLESLIHDYLLENKLENEFKNISANAYIYLFIWRWLSSLVAWYLFYLNPYYPIYLTIIAYILIIIFILLIIEPNYHKSEKQSNFNQIKSTIKMVTDNSEIKLFLVITFLSVWLWNIYWFTYQPYLKNIWYSVWIIWIIFSIISFVSAYWSHLIKLIQSKYNPVFIAKIILYSVFISSILFYFLNNKLWLIPILILAITFWFSTPLGNNYLSSQVSSDKKATLLSIYSFVITLSYFTFSTISWFLINIYWLKQVYFWVMILSLIIFLTDIIYSKNQPKSC